MYLLPGHLPYRQRPLSFHRPTTFSLDMWAYDLLDPSGPSTHPSPRSHSPPTRPSTSLLHIHSEALADGTAGRNQKPLERIRQQAQKKFNTPFLSVTNSALPDYPLCARSSKQGCWIRWDPCLCQVWWTWRTSRYPWLRCHLE